MKITGIVAEYNPFHNGHKYQADMAKKDCDAVVAVMSGSFVQRGDVAIFDKFTRAECAVRCGIDLVIELPSVYSLSTAQKFAQGAVSTLDALGIVDTLCFGSENGDIASLINAADIIADEPPEVSEKIQKLISEGLSYPSARQKAFVGIIAGNILSLPNNILALEYIRALKNINSTIIPTSLKRHAVGYHDTYTVMEYASATAIRKMLTENSPADGFVPKQICDIYKTAPTSDKERLFPILYYAIRSGRLTADIADVSEGLENRIYKECARAQSFEELAAAVKTKRYTLTRINRILMCTILGITDSMTALPPQYIRILAMNKTGASILAQAKKSAKLPIITKPSSFCENSSIWECEKFASDICSAAFGSYGFNNELIRSPIYVGE